MSATWRSFTCSPNKEQLSNVTRRINLIFRIRGTGLAVKGVGCK
jgi:hypothetical protein